MYINKYFLPLLLYSISLLFYLSTESILFFALLIFIPFFVTSNSIQILFKIILFGLITPLFFCIFINYEHIGLSSMNEIFLIKELSFISLLVITFIKNKFVIRLPNNIGLIFIIFLCYLSINFVMISSGNISFALFASLRDFILFFLIYLYSLNSQSISNDDLMYELIYFSKFIIILTVIFSFIYYFTNFLDYNLYTLFRYEGAFPIKFDYPVNFYTYLFDNFLMRFPGINLDPPSFGKFISFPILFLLLFYDKKSTLLYGIVGLIFLLLTIGKAGILLFFLTFIYYFLQKIIDKKIIILFFFLSLIFGFFLLKNEPNFIRHSEGVILALNKISFFGSGIGMSGQNLINFNITNNISGDIIKESFVAGLISQIGFIGLFLYLTLYFSIFKNNSKGARIISINKNSSVVKINSLSKYFLIFLIISSLFSNSSVNFFSLLIPLFIFVKSKIVLESNYEK